MDKFEKLVNEIMRDAEKDGEPVTREEAEEMARMELGAKDIKNYTRGVAPKAEKAEKKMRKPQVSDEKKEIFETILRNIDRACGVERKNVEVLKENKLIRVKIGEKTFKIDVIEERQSKK